MKKFTVIFCILFLTIHAQAQSGSNSASDAVPENLGLGLRELAILDRQGQTQLRDALSSSKGIMTDAEGRVIVNVYPDGNTTVSDVRAKLAGLGVEIIAVETNWRRGVISAALPISQANVVATLPGVQSVMLARKPIRRVGVVTAESSVVEHAREVNTPGVVTALGLLGRGISVGLVSDSYDNAAGVTRASVGVASGDLPGFGNPDGYTQPVVVLADGSGSFVTDEGRGMAEIVHDIAPAAKLCFSTSGMTQATMAASIRNLRTNPQTLCDVIVDDIAFPDEPFFSDGVIAQAIEEVANSTSLPGKKVSFFTASGNNPGGYQADANIISTATAQAYRGNINLTPVPVSLYAGGFHNLGTSASPAIALSVTTGPEDGHTLTFQWDDPFNTGGVTTDYNLLVFNVNGQYIGALSGTDNNQATDQPLEIIDLAADTTYQLVICLRTAAPPAARHLRLISADGGSFSGPNISHNVISIFGHATAASANCIAAYVYNALPSALANYNPGSTSPPPGPYEPALETFNADGGSVPIYFNAQGQRLATPELRLKPDFAAVDGVNTSFFPPGADADYDNDGHPNFFGTSAAAPNAAAFGALLLEAAGGPASRTPAQIRSTLLQATSAHDLDPNAAQATTSGSSFVKVTANGDDSNESAMSSNFFTATFTGQPGETLSQLTIDLTNTSLVFDPSVDLGFPFTVGQNAGGVSVASSLSADQRTLTVTFGNFTPDKSVSFGIDRDLAGINAGGNAADLIAGATITAVTGSGQTSYGAFANQLGSAFAPSEGYGLVDARVAVEKIVGRNLAVSGAPANLSTRGIVGTGDSVLIGGVIIGGDVTKKVIVRAIGPSLPVPGALADPTLELYDANGQSFAMNDNWQDDPDQAAQIRASTVPPNDPRESALVVTLNPGSYTAIVRGAGGSTGVGLVEVYDLAAQPSSARLANIATRGQVQTNDNVLIAGFILRQNPSQVVVRAVGPSLTGVAGILADPSLELHDNQGNIVMANDNWQEDSFQAIQIQTVGLAPLNPLESAIIATLNPAAYTLVVRGAHATTGVALVEVYDLQ